MQILTMKSPSLESWGSGLASHWRHRTGSSERRANSRQGERIVSLHQNPLAPPSLPQTVVADSQILSIALCFTSQLIHALSPVV